MATAIQFEVGPIQASQNRKVKVNGSAGNTAPFQTPWTRFVNTSLIAALSGTATAVTATVLRSAVDPNFLVNGVAQGPAASPADSAGFSGSLATGITPNVYTELGAGWWCINVTAISGGTCTATLSGQAGKV
jgi:hypothetical protein